MTFRAALLLLTLASPSFAQSSNCGPSALIADQLADRYGESVIGAGLTSNGALVQFYANSETGTWTITGTTAAGHTCVLSAGEDFRSYDLTPRGEAL